MKNKKILTGLKATSSQLHLGNYFGAIKPMIEFINENDYESYIFVATMHSFTQLHDGNKIKQYLKNLLKIYIACGIIPEKTHIYNHANLPAHAQLSRVLGCLTNVGFMKRMHAYKDANTKGIHNDISVGTFTYPILMAADIILYDVELVPVGKDQKQHVEYARDIAIKFNNNYGDTFVVPQPIIQEDVATVPGIDGRKMSKSYNNYIGLLDDESVLLKKIKTITTAALSIQDPKNPDECNVYNILKLFLDKKDNENIRNKYLSGGLSYKEVKDLLFERSRILLNDIQLKFNSISDQYLFDTINKTHQYLGELGNKKIKQVYDKIGFNL